MKQRVQRSQPVQRPTASTWVPPEERDSAWYIFHKLFSCRVQRIQTLTVEEMREYGTPTSGDPEYDKQMQNERIDRMLTIADMVEYWKQGVTIGVVNEKDTKTIYQLITDHLIAWKNKLEYEPAYLRDEQRLEDLIALDKFANVVYQHAKYQFTETVVESFLHRKLTGLSRTPRGSFLKPITPEKTTINPEEAAEEEKNKYPQRVSMEEAFTRGRAQSAADLRWK